MPLRSWLGAVPLLLLLCKCPLTWNLLMQNTEEFCSLAQLFYPDFLSVHSGCFSLEMHTSSANHRLVFFPQS